MSSKNQGTFRLGVALLAALATLSCGLEGSDGSPARPSSQRHALSARPVSKATVAAHGELRESSSAPPSSEALARESSVRQRFEAALQKAPGRAVSFVDCEQAPCVARFRAPDAATLRDLLADVSQSFDGQVNFTARERLDPYMGRSFEADVTLETASARSVPAGAADLFD